jgi:hypothetical protein
MPHNVPMEIRKVRYPRRFQNNNPDKRMIDKGGMGEEIARSGFICDTCFIIHIPRIVDNGIKKIKNPTIYEERYGRNREKGNHPKKKFRRNDRVLPGKSQERGIDKHGRDTNASRDVKNETRGK